MVHGLRLLRDGKASGTATLTSAAPQACRALGNRPEGSVQGSPLGANTNVIGHAGRTWPLVEGGIAQYELTDELDTVGGVGLLRDAARRQRPPQAGPETGELHAVTYGMERGNTVQYSVIGVDGGPAHRRHHRARQSDDARLSLMEKYVVFYDLPVAFDPALAAEMTACPSRCGCQPG